MASPPSVANQGAWKVPANVGLNAVLVPNIPIRDADWATLNVDEETGRFINDHSQNWRISGCAAP